MLSLVYKQEISNGKVAYGHFMYRNHSNFRNSSLIFDNKEPNIE
jgi:hypothetical protein